MKYKVIPWKHQLRAIEKAKDLPWYALLFEMGAGKTSTAINILRHKFNEEKRILRTLILSPPIVIQNWQDEWYRYSSIDESLVIKLQGSGKKRLETFLEYAYVKDLVTGERIPRGCVFLTNYEALLMPDLYQAFIKWKPEVVVNDEAHRVRSHDAKRSQLLEELCNPINKKIRKLSHDRPLVYNLTGTPVLKDALDLFQQYKIMLGGFPAPGFFEEKDFYKAQDYLIRNYYSFRARYFMDNNAGWKGQQNYFPEFVIKPGAIEEINTMIYKCSMRVTKAECMDLPPEIIVPIKVEMTPEQKKNYAELRKDFVTHVNGERVSVDLAMIKALRLLQITSGFISIDQAQGSEEDPVKHSYAKTPKLEALKQLLEDLTPHSKVLVWAVWKENYRQIRELCEELGIKYVEVHGEISSKEKDRAVSAFQADPSIKVFISNPSSGGVGLNLVQAAYSIFYSRTFKLEDFLQACARNYRGGTKEQGHEKITHYNLICENTMDEIAVESLVKKEQMSVALLKQSTNKI